MLVIKDVHKSFGRVSALRGVCAEIDKGELISFLGPSGCGKTTLMRTICGLTKPDSGEIVLEGSVINEVPPDRRGIQMCFQHYALFPHLTVAGNIGYGLQVHKWRKDKIAARVDELLHLVQLDGVAGRRVDQISGGQQQRVALARALALAPKVLLLDEPLSNLDANLRAHMRATLREIQQKVNITAVFVTHDQVEAMTISDRLVVMNQGIVEQAGSPVEIYEKPANEFVARFIGYVNILQGRVKDVSDAAASATIETELGESAVALGQDRLSRGERIHVVVRPEAIRLDVRRPAGQTDNAFAGSIRGVMYAGSTVKYTVDVGGKDLIVDEYDPTTHGIRRIGERVVAEIPRNVHILRADPRASQDRPRASQDRPRASS
jgi:iron(III) transport system ATP-binding protein